MAWRPQVRIQYWIITKHEKTKNLVWVTLPHKAWEIIQKDQIHTEVIAQGTLLVAEIVKTMRISASTF